MKNNVIVHRELSIPLEQYREIERKLNSQDSELQQLRERVKELEGWIKEHGENGCPCKFEDSCTCGLDNLLNKGPATPPKEK